LQEHILFCHKTLHISSIFSDHHQEFFYCTFGTGKFRAGFWWPLPSRVRMELLLTVKFAGAYFILP
jgi:hypothetical protein